ncbi:MAG TPA: histidine phosphatase family protein, partial [Chloroflexota bacterium]|nr:histidine phosphatase family protein [Chloroflexota bacterium]
PYTRALETADAIRLATGSPAGIVPLLHEHHVEPLQSDKDEDWPFLTLTALSERFPHFEPPADFAFSPRWHDIPETDHAVVRRGRRVLDEIWQKYSAPPNGKPDARITLVTHGSPAGKLVMALLGLELPQKVNVRIDNASITIFDYHPDSKVLMASNRVDHLLHLGIDLSRQDPGYPLPKR